MELLINVCEKKKRHHQECIMDERAYALDLRLRLALYMYNIVLLYVSIYRCCIRIPSYTTERTLPGFHPHNENFCSSYTSVTYSHMLLLFSLSLLYLSYYILNISLKYSIRRGKEPNPFPIHYYYVDPKWNRERLTPPTDVIR